MTAIRRGFRIAVSAARGWRTNPMLPFAVRGIAGGSYRARIAVFLLVLVLLVPVGRELMQFAGNFVVARIGGGFGGAGAILLAAYFIAMGLLLTPLVWYALLPVAMAVGARRWMAGSHFQRDMRLVPDATSAVVGSLVVLLLGTALLCHVAVVVVQTATQLLFARSAPGLPVLWYVSESKLVRAMLQGKAMGFSLPVPASLAVAVELAVRCCGVVRLASQVAIFFAIAMRTRTVVGEVAAIVGVRLVELVVSTLAWDVANGAVAYLSGPSSPMTTAATGALLAVDLLATPVATALWACWGCWALARIHDHVASAITAQDASLD